MEGIEFLLLSLVTSSLLLSGAIADIKPVITSNVKDADGVYSTNPGDEVTFICQVYNSLSMEWTTSSFLPEDTGRIRYTHSDGIGKLKHDSRHQFVGNITSLTPLDSDLRTNFTSTLTFEAKIDFSPLQVTCLSDSSNTSAILVSGTLTSNLIEVGNDHFGCDVQQTAVFTCKRTSVTILIWIAEPFVLDSDITYSSDPSDTIGRVIEEDRGGVIFTGNLTSKIVDPSDPRMADITTTLQFPLIEEVDSTVIECTDLIESETRRVRIAKNGILPDPPQNVDCILSSLDCGSDRTTLSCTITPPAGDQPIVEYTVNVDGQPIATVGADVLTNALISVVCGNEGVNMTVRSKDSCGQSSNATVVTIDSSVCISPNANPPPPTNLICSLASSSSGCNDDEVFIDCQWEQPTETVPVSSYTFTITGQQPVTGISQETTSYSTCVEPGATSVSITVVSISDCGRMSVVASTTVTLDTAAGLSAGAMAGIVIAVVLVVGVAIVLIILLLYFILRRITGKKFIPLDSPDEINMPNLATPPVVKNLAVSDITETSATVTWKIKGVKPESKCSATLTVQYMDGSVAQEQSPSWNRNRYLLEGLIPLVKYQVNLSATKEKGESSRKGPEVFTTKCGAAVSMFTTPFSVILTWKPPPQYRDECTDKILLTVHNYDDSIHEEFKVSTETVKTVQVEPSKQYYVTWTVTHKRELTTSEKRHVFHTPDPLPECAEISITLTEAVPYYVWQEQGITVELQSDSLPDGSDACPVMIKVFLPNCPELFPDNNDPVSPVVHVSTPVELVKPLKVSVVHCGGSGVRVASGEKPSKTPKKFTTDASVMVTESSQTATVYCPPPESCFVVVSKSNTTFCAQVYFDDQKGDLYMTLAKNIPVYTKILDDHASKKGLQKVQDIPELSFVDGRDVLTLYHQVADKMQMLAEFRHDVASYFTDPEDTSICVVRGRCNNQPSFDFEVNFDKTKKVWIYFSTLNQQIENQEMIARDAITLKALHDSNDILELQQSWREFATNLGVGMRIASLGHTYQGRASSDRLCAFEVIVQWMRCHPNPTYEALKAAINLSTEPRQRSSIVNENTENLHQSTQAGTVVVMEDVNGLLEKYKYLSTDWELLAVALGLGAYIGYIREKERSVRVRALFQLWTTLEKENATWSKLSKGVAIAGI